MFRIANLAEEYGKGKLRLTPTQNIILPYVKEVDALSAQLKEMIFQFDGSRLRWNSLGCSSDFCGRTRSPHAKEVLKTVVEHLERQISVELLDEANFRIYINGCPNNCCPSLISGIGLNGRQVKEGNVIKQTYDILLGGSQGQEPMFARIVEQKVQSEALKTRLVSILKHYKTNKEQSETFSTFCNRHTVEELNRYLTDVKR
jgi:ferredoxin-nitrite reductase